MTFLLVVTSLGTLWQWSEDDLVYSSINSRCFWASDAASRCPGNIYLGKNFLLPSFCCIFTPQLVTSLLKCERYHMANWTDLVIWPHSPLTLDLNTAMNHCPEVVQILQPGHRCPWHRPGFWPRYYHTFGRHISRSWIGSQPPVNQNSDHWARQML